MRDPGERAAKQMFGFSILYLFAALRAAGGGPRPRHCRGDGIMNRTAAVDDWQKRRRGKNLALLGVLLALIALLYFITMARLGSLP